MPHCFVSGNYFSLSLCVDLRLTIFLYFLSLDNVVLLITMNAKLSICFPCLSGLNLQFCSRRCFLCRRFVQNKLEIVDAKRHSLRLLHFLSLLLSRFQRFTLSLNKGKSFLVSESSAKTCPLKGLLTFRANLPLFVV